MSEPFAELEDAIRSFAKDVHPAVSLRQRILTASRDARERQSNRIRVQRNACCLVLGLCVIYAGMQVQWSSLQTFGGSNGDALAATSGHAIKESQSSTLDERSAMVSETERMSPVFDDPIEWRTADSHWKRRDRQAALISHYF